MHSRWVVPLAIAIGPCHGASRRPRRLRRRPQRKEKPWTAPRTPDGHPDLQGTWTNGTITPLERPDGSRVTLTKDEVERRRKRRPRIVPSVSTSRAIRTGRRRRRAATDRPARQAMSAATTISGWIPATASRSSTASGEARSSWIRPTARSRRSLRSAAAERGARRRTARPGPVRPPGASSARRALHHVVRLERRTAHAAQLLLQQQLSDRANEGSRHDPRRDGARCPDHPDGGERLPNHLRPWMGDSIGRWEGDTLVVETTNFHPLQRFRGASENLKVIERFTRVSADTILYKFTIDDPSTFTRPWSGEVPFNRIDDLIYDARAMKRTTRCPTSSVENAPGSADRPRRAGVGIHADEHMDTDRRLRAAVRHDSVAGHHAFGAEFDPDAPIRLQGKVVKLEWVNPHAWIHIEVKKPDGTTEVWMVEGGRQTLLRRGLTRESCLRHRAHRRWIPDEGPLAQAGERPRRHVHGRPQDLHGFVGNRRAARRPRSDRAEEGTPRGARKNRSTVPRQQR